jgi:hypothetical protein
MPKLIATRDFKYGTRRLMAGDEFEARNDLEARIYTDVRRVAEVAPAKVTKAVIPTVEEVLTAEVIEDSAPVLEPVSESPVTVEVAEPSTQKKPRKKSAAKKKAG